MNLLDQSQSGSHDVNGMDVTKHSMMDAYVKENPEPSPQDYSRNAPKILLETISARLAAVVIVITYVVFAVGFVVDSLTTFQSFKSADKYLLAQLCPTSQSNLSIVYYSSTDFGCYYGNSWYGIVRDLENVISIQLDVQRTNFSSTYTHENNPVKCNYQVWACYQAEGCGDTFTGYSSRSWMSVLQETNKTIDVTFTPDQTVANLNIFPNTFQNQEAIPSEGLVQSYFLEVEYESDPSELFTTNYGDLSYIFDVVSRPPQLIKNIFIVILMILSFIIFGGYVYVVYTYNKKSKTPWLPEQKWLVIYFLAVILYQNPVTLVIDFSKKTNPTSAYSSYILDSLSQSLLFIIWLLFSDSIHRTYTSTLRFYGPKLFFGFLIMFCSVYVVTCQFPSLDPVSGRNKNPVQAVSNWSTNLKLSFCIFSVAFIVLQWIWTAAWFWNIYFAHRTLNKLPYMLTRYQQLSHRFFTVQAFAVTLYFVFQYFVVIYLISINDSAESTTLTNLADNINTLFREQTQLFGKILFLTTYAIILAFMFLPASFSETYIMRQNLINSTYVITESELKAEKRRRFLLRHQPMFQSSLNPAGFLQNITQNLTNNLLNAKTDVFCVDLAIMLRDLSYESYYDPVGVKTLSSYEGEMDIESLGFRLVTVLYCEEHQAFCYIAREIANQKRIVVVFRGTASQRQMKDNLNYKRRPLSILTMKLQSLDVIDGLTPDPKDASKLNTTDIGTIVETIQEPIDPTYEDIPSERSSRASSMSKSPPRLSDDLWQNGGSGHDHEMFDYQEMDTSVREKKRQDQHNYIRDTIIDGATAVEKGVVLVASNIKGATSTIIDTTTGAVVGAAKMTPGLNIILRTTVHSGFWEAYECSTRIQLHAILRRELSQEPADIIFTGHSLGGAIATYAALDFSLHSLPRIKSHLRYSLSSDIEANNNERNSHDKSAFAKQRSNSQSRLRNINVTMYNFGAPKVGNGAFAQLYDKIVPNSFRVVVDGDLVTALPPSRVYRHIGVCVVIDSTGAGSIIIDPSFVEVWLRIQSKSSVANHSLLMYKKGLLGVKIASKYIESLAHKGSVDMMSFLLRLTAESTNAMNEEEKLGRKRPSSSSLASQAYMAAPVSSPIAANISPMDKFHIDDASDISIQSDDSSKRNTSSQPLSPPNMLNETFAMRHTDASLISRDYSIKSSKKYLPGQSEGPLGERYTYSFKSSNSAQTTTVEQIHPIQVHHNESMITRHMANDVRNVESLLAGMQDQSGKGSGKFGSGLRFIAGRRFLRGNRENETSADNPDWDGLEYDPNEVMVENSLDSVETLRPTQTANSQSNQNKNASLQSWGRLTALVRPLARHNLARRSAPTKNSSTIDSSSSDVLDHVENILAQDGRVRSPAPIESNSNDAL